MRLKCVTVSSQFKNELYVRIQMQWLLSWIPPALR